MKKRIGLFVGLLAAVLLLSAISISAQQPPPADGPAPQDQPRPPHPPMPNDPLGDAMFPPEMIMMHTRELDLTQEQKTFMRAEINKATTRFNELQWQLQDAMEALHDTMKANPVNERQALAQLDKVLDTEREIKHLHIAMGIRIKNQLTPAQQEKLMAMHAMMGPGRGQGHGRGDGRGPDGPGRRPGVPGEPDGPSGGPGPGGPPPGGRP
jgi:Spy/CpxP family protein refolding chaperone